MEASVSAWDGNTTLDVIACPGHTDDHVCLWLQEECGVFSLEIPSLERALLFSSCYSDYIASLQALLRHSPKVIYPGHGPRVDDAAALIQHYLQHRQQRESQIVNAVRHLCASSADSRGVTANQIVKAVYTDTPANLHSAAAVNVSHHLRKLWREGVVRPVGIDEGNSGDVEKVLAMDEYGRDTVPSGESHSEESEGSVDFATLCSINNVRWSLSSHL